MGSNADWMGRVYDDVRQHPLATLVIPGSHNSFTYSLDPSLPVGPDESGLVRWLGDHLPAIFKPIIDRWSRCQKCDVTSQLDAGVRYFDFRICRLNPPNELRVLHALYGGKIEPILKEIDVFLDAHPKEIVILDIQHVYNFNSSNHKYLVDLLTSTFEDKLCPICEDISQLTIESMVKKRQRVIAIYPAMAKVLNVLWPRYLCPNPWADTENVTSLVEFLTAGLNKRNPCRLFVSQAILTPSKFTVVRRCCSSLEKTLAKVCDDHLRQWLISKDRPANLNIIIADFMDSDGLLELIISMNF